MRPQEKEIIVRKIKCKAPFVSCSKVWYRILLLKTVTICYYALLIVLVHFLKASNCGLFFVLWQI